MQCFLLVQCFCTQVCKMTEKSRQWIVRVLFAHTQTQRKEMCRLAVAGVHAMLNCGCMAMTVWMEIFRGINFYVQECYRAKVFSSSFVRLQSSEVTNIFLEGKEENPYPYCQYGSQNPFLVGSCEVVWVASTCKSGRGEVVNNQLKGLCSETSFHCKGHLISAPWMEICQ